MPTIVSSDKYSIKSLFAGSVDIFAATAARVYTTSLRSDRWTPQGHTGALLLLKDKQIGGLFFRLISLEDDARIVWEHELYFDFEYRLDSSFYHSFESDSNEQVGFLFADEHEADDFARVVYQKSEILQISSNSNPKSKVSDQNHSRTTSVKSSSASITSSDSNNSKPSFLSGIFKRNSNKDTNKEKEVKPASKSNGKLTAEDIGDPTDFRHLAHIGFNSQTGAFDVQNIPAEWRQIFQKAGVTNEQLQSRETAGFIADFMASSNTGNASTSNASNSNSGNVQRTGSQNSFKTKVKGPPPPPPAKNIKKTVVKKVDVDEDDIRTSRPSTSTTSEASTSSQTSRMPPVDDSKAQLLASIRQAGIGVLKPVDKQADQPTTRQQSDPPAADQSDIMASMLAKALAERNKRVTHYSDSDREDDDW